MTLRRIWQKFQSSDRRGSILVLSAFVMVLVIAFTAFAVDIGHIVLTKAQLQRGADAAALAAAMKLSSGLGEYPESELSEVELLARYAAQEVAAVNGTTDRSSIYVDRDTDVRFGQYQYNAVSGQWEANWGVAPYNVVEVTVRRTSGGGDNAPPLDLFFAHVIGNQTADLQVTAASGLLPSSGFRVTGNKRSGVMPIAYDLESWLAHQEIMETFAAAQPPNEEPQQSFSYAVFRRHINEPTFLLVGNGNGNGNSGGGNGNSNDDDDDETDYGTGFGEDNYKYDPLTGNVVPGQDGIPEFNLYPSVNNDEAPGNRGLLEFGPSGASNIRRQIEHGFNETDLDDFGGVLSFDNGPLVVSGETGLKNTIKEPLEAIIGETRAIPIFSTVDGNGSNAEFTLVKFVGIRIMHIDMSGNDKLVIVQPAIHVDSTATASTTTTVQEATIFTPAALLQ